MKHIGCARKFTQRMKTHKWLMRTFSVVLFLLLLFLMRNYLITGRQNKKEKKKSWFLSLPPSQSVLEHQKNDQSFYLSLVAFSSMGLVILVTIVRNWNSAGQKKKSFCPPINAQTKEVKMQTWNWKSKLGAGWGFCVLLRWNLIRGT